ncbi:hypothetical protein NDU88_006323 [Pleurodeles waltl]|uniref:Uncharacterized protein n=1 Tax=Pleurodeles waltl TaxID=8319 RepID=A0AAV7NUS6_PLEWA|nr:hypothetical protein NDU88_006323 [Pleurodeles waltl]
MAQQRRPPSRGLASAAGIASTSRPPRFNTGAVKARRQRDPPEERTCLSGIDGLGWVSASATAAYAERSRLLNKDYT